MIGYTFQCRDCGELMDGDGYHSVYRCPYSMDDWELAAPDEGPFYCGLQDDDGKENDNTKWSQ